MNACVDMWAIQDAFVDRTTIQREIRPTVIIQTTAKPKDYYTDYTHHEVSTNKYTTRHTLTKLITTG